jgi:excisionase family DNA binding protein
MQKPITPVTVADLRRDNWLTAKEVSKLLSLHPKTVYRLIESDRIRAIKVGLNAIRVNERELERYLNEKC